uniref:Family with sequence similarity 110 member C n=1 Tax=Lates calcarifer TaxID=8187 RepID=A0A4W6DBH2_LATCA
MELESETKGRMSAVERLAASKPKYVKSQQVVNSTQEPVISLGSNRDGNFGTGSNSTQATCGTQTCSPGQVRRSSSKKRPDSLLTLQAEVTKVTAGLLAVPQCEKLKRSGKGVSRSHSDISSRYSKNFADFEAFFKYCGLDGEVIESLGKENFSARSDEIAINIRSISVSTSDDGFSRSSGGSDGLLEDELQKKMRQGTSVIERNARIIKWLYSCKNETLIKSLE